ncbi:hypothetical protein BGZ46_001618 [Entomortierella lignicola]|nr:hypothetical protein BGZ46_001618 [Entomortierella lignicola]
MSDVKHNEMQAPKPADEECFAVFENEAIKEAVLEKIHKMNREDSRHGLHEMDKLKHISAYKPVLYAIEDVSYGRNYFAKIHLGDEKYVHARAHKSHENKLDFYSLHNSPQGAVFDRNSPLEYFNE